MEFVQTSIDICIFFDGSDVMQVLDAIMTEAHGALMYYRHRQMTGVLKVNEAEEM